METDSVDFGDWIKGGSRRCRNKKKRLYMDKTFPEGTQQSRGIPSCEGRDMWTQDPSCDFLNWSKQQQKSWADSKRLQHPVAGPCLSLSVWEKETRGQEHRPATQWKQRGGGKKTHRVASERWVEKKTKQNRTMLTTRPLSLFWLCEKQKTRCQSRAEAGTPWICLSSAEGDSHMQNTGVLQPMCGLRRASRCQGCTQNEPLGWLLDVSVSFTCMHMIRTCTENRCHVVMMQVSPLSQHQQTCECVVGALHVGPSVNIIKHLAIESLVGWINL